MNRYVYAQCPLCGSEVRAGTHTGVRDKKIDCRATRKAYYRQVIERGGIVAGVNA